MRYALLLAALLIATPSWAQSAKSWAGAMWVWDEADANKVTQTNDPRYLRLAFDLAAKPMQAELWITVDNVYTAYVNEKTKIQRAGSVSDGWTKTDFDASTWSNAVVLGDTAIAPWNLSASSVANASGSPGKGL